MAAEELLRVDIRDEDGVFAVRRAGREVAAAVGLDAQDQVRVATALSEVGRDLYAHAGQVEAAFLLERGAASALLVELRFSPGAGGRPPAEGTRAASRLMDLVEEDVDVEDQVVIRIRKTLPAGPGMADAAVVAVRDRLGHLAPTRALEELSAQNAELVGALEDVRRQREELRSLNAELEETNHGVMALYNQLSQELEDTNRGVVALYAELEEKSDQLREASEAKNRFWANISHELRTPVNGVIGLTRLLLDPAAEPLTAEQRHQIGLIADAGGTLRALVDELLDMAKAEQGRLVADQSEVDVPALVARLAALLEPMAAEAGLTLAVDVADAPAALVTDETMLTRVLRNLLANGVKFTREGEVRLAVRRTGADGDGVEFTVSDTGIGVPPEDVERVFEEFYQVPGTGSGGTGLGLPYARRLAQTLGGDLSLDSVLGEGTTVTLRLPAQRELGALGLRHVLVVDDEEPARALLRRLVGDAARVTEASGGHEALELAAADRPDLVLLDLRMPAGDGYDVLAGLPADVPVVLVTSIDVTALADDRLDRAGAVLDKGRIGPAMLADAAWRAVRGGSGEKR
ncbi:response regulator [Actinomadura sp. PM05-2]|uniref:histidine kinase n=1 Tax=Actinomadura parmotrematis TaxID=2864039 RepID=A0ABS7FQM2_9ACTN|nr:response regulator [Actinomadura parmotrematis]